MAARQEVLIAFTTTDETSAQITRLNQDLTTIQKVGGQTGAALEKVNAQSISASKQISALAATTRFAASSLISELSPALGSTATQMASLSAVATTTGGVLSGIAVAGAFTVAITVLGKFIELLQGARQEWESFNQVLTSFDPPRIRREMNRLLGEIEETARVGRILTFGMEGVGDALDDTSRRVAELRQRFLRLEAQEITVQLALDELAGKAEQAEREFKQLRGRVDDFTASLAQIDLSEAQTLVGTMQNLHRAADDLSFAAAAEELGAFDRRAGQIASKLRDIQQEFGEAGLTGAIQALGPAIDENVIAKLNTLEEPTARFLRTYTQTLREAQRQSEVFARTAASTLSGVLFDALEGRIKTFEDFAKRSLINIARAQVEAGITRALTPGGFA